MEKPRICRAAAPLQTPAKWRLGGTAELAKSDVGPSRIGCPGRGLSYRYGRERLAATRVPFPDCAPPMHFLFLFSRFLATCALAIFPCSQGLSLSSFSTSICSHLPFNSSLPPPPSTWTTLHLFSKPLFLEENKIHEI